MQLSALHRHKEEVSILMEKSQGTETQHLCPHGSPVRCLITASINYAAKSCIHINQSVFLLSIGLIKMYARKVNEKVGNLEG